MLAAKALFGGFSVDDLDKAKEFYGTTLGLKLQDEFGGVSLSLPGGSEAWIYQKPDHVAATYTTLNFVVDDIDAAVDELTTQGVKFERYPGGYQDEKGVARGKDSGYGPNIAWFTDPAGNILSVLEPAEKDG